MATVIAVHGTFSKPTKEPKGSRRWWEPESSFHRTLTDFACSSDGALDFQSFVWSGANSEIERRRAGLKLLLALKFLEAKNEPYILIGHSHGGSVIANALVYSAQQSIELPCLKKWITVGTPFFNLTPGTSGRRFRPAHLPLARQIILLAALMLLSLFLFYAAGELISAQREVFFYSPAFVFNLALTCLPAGIFYCIFIYLTKIDDLRPKKKWMDAAGRLFSDRCLILFHHNDEALWGLRHLKSVRSQIVQPEFAVSTVTALVMVLMPLFYLLVVTSPSVMRGIGTFSQRYLYDVERYKPSFEGVSVFRQELRRKTDALRHTEHGGDTDSFAQAKALRQEIAEKLSGINASIPNFYAADRAYRFARRFMMRDGKVCASEKICGAGNDYALNSKLIFHLLTDDLSDSIVNSQLQAPLLYRLLPIVLVPVLMATLAATILISAQWGSRVIGKIAAATLNEITSSEIKRTAYGNDTSGESVVDIGESPSWAVGKGRPLPPEVAQKITQHSNEKAAQSIARMREALTKYAMLEQNQSQAEVLSSYLSWSELIHTSYFDVPEFGKLIAITLVDCDGFGSTGKSILDPDVANVRQWLQFIERFPDSGISL